MGLALEVVLALALAAACGEGQVSGEGDAGPAQRCRPSGGGPHWIAEGETLEVAIACELDWPDARFEIDPVPPGAVWDADSATLRWTPGLDQAAVHELTIAEPSLGETGAMTIGVADAWDHPDNVPVVDPLAYPLEYGVPVLFLSPPPQVEEPYQPVTVVYRGRTYQAEGKLRGASSLAYPKKSYTIKFDGVKFSDPDADGGFVSKDRIVLTSTFDDNAYLRQWLAFELWSRLEPTIPVQAYMVVVYSDGEFYGLYTLTDHIDDELMKAVGLAESGNLYKAVSHDANFRLTAHGGGDKGTLHDGYEKKEGTPEHGEPGAYDDLDELVQFVATADDGAFAAEIGQRVELADYEKWWMLATFIRADDSAGKNSYHYHDATRSWRVAPWDFNASFGQAWTTHRVAANPVDPYTNLNRLFERLLADPELGAAMRARYRAALEDGPLAADTVLELVDQMAASIGPVARRDWARWQTQYRSFGRWSDRSDWTSHEEEVAYVRSWLEARSAAVSAMLD